MAEFACNNQYQQSIKRTPSFANYGVNPEYQPIGHLMQGKITSPEDMSQLHDTLQAEMMEAPLRHKEYYDTGRKPDPSLQSGDMVWLLPRNIPRTRPCKKLDSKKIGPFKILAKIGGSAYKLDLPPSMRIHNTFHIFILELYHANKFSSQQAQPLPPIIIEGEPEYELEQIIDSRLHSGKLQYPAKWTGYSPKHDKVWYPYENFENAGIATQQFHQKYPTKPSQDQDRGTRQRGDLVSITPPQQLAPPPPPPRMTTPRPRYPRPPKKGGKLRWDYPRAPHTEPHTNGNKQKKGNKLERSTICCHGQRATTTGAQCTTGTRKPRGGFLKTDLGLCQQYRYRTGTKNNRGNAMGRA